MVTTYGENLLLIMGAGGRCTCMTCDSQRILSGLYKLLYSFQAVNSGIEYRDQRVLA